MFGENTLTSINEIKIDKQGKITLPKYTSVETNERLFFLRLKNEIRIYGEKELENISKVLFDHIKNNSDIKTYNRLKRTFFGLMLMDESVKKGNKIIIPKKFREEYKLNQSIILIGSKNHLKILNNTKNNQILAKKHN